jgi:lipopolysaccharide transport system permease protein
LGITWCESIPIDRARKQMEATVSNPAEMMQRAECVSTKPVPGSVGHESEDQLLTVIERKAGWGFLDLSELWRFRELLFFLMWRDVKVRYKQTVLGAAWAVLQPLATMAAFAVFLGRVAAVEDAAIPYPLFVFAGLLPWLFFTSSVNAASSSLVGSQNLITKVYFPRLLVPLAAVAAAILDFLIAMVMLFILMPFFGATPDWKLLAVPFILLILVAQAAGLGVFLGGLTVSYRDFKVIVPLCLQLWMFATPAIFLQDLDHRFGPRMQDILQLNPLHGVIVNFRAAALGGEFDLFALGIAASWAVGLLLFGSLYFRRVERGFADII